jgi:hypothetical protein
MASKKLYVQEAPVNRYILTAYANATFNSGLDSPIATKYNLIVNPPASVMRVKY